MPTVPVIQDSVQLQTDTGRQRVRADPDAFGAAQARGTAALAQSMQGAANIVEREEDEWNELAAGQGEVELARGIQRILRDPENGYVTSPRGRGMAAADNREAVERELDGLAAQVGAGLRSESAAAVFLPRAQRAVLQALGDTADHAARERDRYANEISEARVLTYVDQATAAHSDPVVVAENMNMGIAELTRSAQRLGWGDEVRDHRISQFRSAIASNVIVQLATTDPNGAQEFYDLMRPQLTSQAAGELLTSMRVVQRQHSEAIEGAGWQAFANGQPLSSMPTETYQELTTNPLLGAAHARLTEAYRTRAAAYARGDNARPNSPAYITGFMWASRNPEQFLREGALEDYLSTNAAQITQTDTASLLSLRERMRLQGGDPEKHTRAFNGLRAAAMPAFRSMGLELEPARVRRGQDRERVLERADAFDAALMAEVVDYMGTHGVDPRGEDAQQVIGRALLRMDTDDFRGVSEYFGASQRGRASQFLVDGDRGRTRTSAVAPPSEGVVVPFDLIPVRARNELIQHLRRYLPNNRMPTRGEVENAFAARSEGEEIVIDVRRN